MGIKEDFILDTTESMEVTGGNPVFTDKPQLCHQSRWKQFPQIGNDYRLIFHILCNGRVTSHSLVT
jgi:hypothetical protein